LGFSEEAVVIGNVGRDDVAKGRSYLLESFARVAAREPRVVLMVVGRGMDAHNREMVDLARRLGISEKMRLVGEHAALEQVYPAFDIYCSSSVSEGFPNVIAEAMSSGLPIVATDVGSSRELVEGVGVVIPPRSVDALASSLLAVLREGPAEWSERGRLGRKRIESEYGISGVVARYHELYTSLITRSRVTKTRADSRCSN
jgi:glycosyltransferase involved in cell wall biosynthesis